MTRRRARGSSGGEHGRPGRQNSWALWAALMLAAATLPVAAAAASVPAGAQAVQPPNTWSPTAGPMSVARTGHTATLLPDGEVLVAGGATNTADLYDPSTGTFTPTGSMSVARTNATATLLQSGDVLVAGGMANRGRQVASAELYDPSTGNFTPTGSMHTARSGDTATLLADGKVLVAGGGCNRGHGSCNTGSFLDNLRSAELYNPKTGAWSITGSMQFERQYFTATLLDDGDVLVAGGFASCDDDFCFDNRQAELYNPKTGKWSTTGSMHRAREQFSATLLASGEVLVAGGLNEGGSSDSPKSYSEAELYDPTTGAWSPTGSMAVPRYGQASALLPVVDWVLVTGGTSDATSEVYQPATGKWVRTSSMSTPRTDLTATVLSDGNVLAAGGTGTDGSAQATAEIYENSSGPLVSIRPRTLSFGAQQVGNTGKVQSVTITNVGTTDLHVSGVDISGTDPGDFVALGTCGLETPGASCSMGVSFAPTAIDLRQATVGVADDAPGSPQVFAVSGYGRGPGSWTPTGSLAIGREGASSTVLPDGDVLVAGGENAEYQGSLSDAELYDPSTGTFTETGALNVARAFTAGALLANGDVLVAGGLSNVPSALSSTELYDPATQSWSSTTPMNTGGYGLTATVLTNGAVLLTGFGASPPEVYDPVDGTWTDTGPLPAANEDATATLLGNGDVLVAGGDTTAAALYDPATNDWSATGSMAAVQDGRPTATLLGNGDVLVAGGVDPREFMPLATSEVYDPSTATWTLTSGQMSVPRDGQAAVELPNGNALVVGGCTSVCDNGQITATTEEYDAHAGYWFPIGSMIQARYDPSATVLADGDVLVASGSDYCCQYYATADLYTIDSASVQPASGHVGQRVTLSGRGFYAFEPVVITWEFSKIERVKTDADGAFVVKLKVPSGPRGKVMIRATGQKSFGSASTSFQVMP